MNKFNELIDRFPRFQGGFVWDWQDKSLVGRTADGKRFFAYGGDFGETMHDEACPYFMTNNGVVMPDLTWKPVAYELKEGYCPVRIAPVPRDSAWSTLPPIGKALIVNHDPVNSLAAYRITAQVLENGVMIAEKELSLPDLPPLQHEICDVSIPYAEKPGCRYDLNLCICRRAETFFAPAGAQVGLVQLPLESGEFEGGAPLPHIRFEPSAEEVLAKIVPAYITGFLYSAMVHSFCAEQNARASAMDAANRNEDDMLRELQFEYNHERQSAITSEITEVSAGARSRQNRMRKEAQQHAHG